VQSIKQDNQTLIRLTKQSLRLEGPRARRCRRAPDFKGVRDCAKSVYTILRSGWRCSCSGSHAANLRLESRTEDEESDSDHEESTVKRPRFRVVFSYSHGNPVSSTAPWSWEEADIRLIKQKQSPLVQLAQGSLNAPTTKKGVRFKDEAVTAVIKALDPEPDIKPIEDLW
jgi:hypothetical protein